MDTQQQYWLVNRCFATLLATTPDQIIGQTLHHVWPQALADREGKPHTFLTVKFPLRDATGTAWAVCGIATDITDRKDL